MSDPTADEMARMAAETADHTFVYVRLNGAGRWVRDAKFITDCADFHVANWLFAGHVDGARVRLCAVLRGQVCTVDNFEFADSPDVFTDPYAGRLERLNRTLTVRQWFSVLGCWDTGDGPRRYGKVVHAADAEHAELQARVELTEGEFLVAGVVEGRVQVEDVDAVWATVDGQTEPEPMVQQPRRWPLIVAAVVLVAVVAALIWII